MGTDPPKGTLCIIVRGWTDASKTGFLRWVKSQKGMPKAFVDCIKAFSAKDGYNDDTEGITGYVADAHVLELDLNLLSTVCPEDLTTQIIAKTSEHFDPEYHNRIAFVGYSAGGPLLRYALMHAHCRNGDTPAWLRPEIPLRVVYLAGILRGWQLSTAMPALIRFTSPVVMMLASLICLLRDGRHPMITYLRRGAPFIVKGRLMQIDLSQENYGKLPFEQLQFLGSKDEFISPSDCIELSGDPQQIYVEVKNANHLEMVDIDPENPVTRNRNAADDERREKRRALLRRAILGDFGKWQGDDSVIHPDDLNDYFDDLDRPHLAQAHGASQVIEKAVIVLHGIRDNGFWTKRVARNLKTKVTEIRLRAPSPSYGFFSLWDFAWRPRRDAQTRWFMDQYANVRECYPKARISFVGHSNGTYLAQHGLASCDLIEFQRLVFAGSVVRTDFKWSTRENQVTSGVLNLTGTKDHVVSLLPGAMQKLGLRFLNVGGAGFHGFVEQEVGAVPVHNRMLKGGHGAGISEQAWNGIAEFIDTGSTANLPLAERKTGDAILGLLSPLLFVVGVGAIALVLAFLVWNTWTGAAEFALWSALGLLIIYLIFRNF